MSRMFALAAAFAALFVVPALAQTPPQGAPTRIRGTVEKLDGQTLLVKSRDGAELKIAMAPKFGVLGVVKKTVADIKPGDFVAATSVKGTDGKQHAVELHIFLDAQRGVVPEAQLPWDLVPDSLMTNAIVGKVTGMPGNEVLQMKYKGNEAEIVVDKDIPIVSYVPADASLLKPGAAIFMIAFKQADGSLSAPRVTAEKDGVKPPM